MAKHSQIDRLDRAIDALLARSGAPLPRDAELAALGRIAAELRELPGEKFKDQLKINLGRSKDMGSKAIAVPEQRQTATLYLCVRNAAEAIEFYKRAFGAREVTRLTGPGTKIGHAEIRIGESAIMLSDEFPDYGALSPESVGGSPVKINLSVANVDATVQQAVAAGAKIVRPVQDQFYGERSGHIADPYGYTWVVSTTIETLTSEELQRRADEWMKSSGAPKHVGRVRPGFGTVTPYIIVERADLAIDFLKRTFGAEETFRDIGSAGGYHCEMRLEDSMFMIGGGAPELAWRGESKPMAFHVYVRDVDAAYQRALDVGATVIDPPSDKPYGERNTAVKDPTGNFWYIATYKGENYKWEGAPTVQPYLHPLRAEPVIRFLKRALGAQELGRHETPQGELMHATFKIGTSHLEMGEAGGPYQPMPGAFYLYVEDADALYQRALQAGATSLYPPTDQPYGDRNAGVRDAFGNTWYIATHLKEATH